MRKQPTFCDATNGFPKKWHLRNGHRNSILMTCYYPDLGSASDWLKQISHVALPIRSTSQIWVVTLSSVWNFCAHFSNVISLGNHWWHPEISAVFLRLFPHEVSEMSCHFVLPTKTTQPHPQVFFVYCPVFCQLIML